MIPGNQILPASTEREIFVSGISFHCTFVCRRSSMIVSSVIVDSLRKINARLWRITQRSARHCCNGVHQQRTVFFCFVLSFLFLFCFFLVFQSIISPITVNITWCKFEYFEVMAVPRFTVRQFKVPLGPDFW